ncbi:MAG: DUF4836 family protein [Prevotella sp.]|jgi:hypothetical protein
MKKIVYCIVALLMAVLSSCSDTDYLNAVPAESRLLMGMNPAKLSGTGNQLLLKTLLHLSNLDNTGLDLSSQVYFFEDAQGNLGLCAKVSNRNKLDETLKRAGQKLSSKKGFDFVALPNNWVAGWSDKAALLMGPVLPDARESLTGTMARYLAANEEDGIVGTPMYAKLDSISAPISLVCEAEALPEQLVAPFTLGAPKDADASQIMIAAEMQVENGYLMINGETFSFKQKLNKALKKATDVYRPIEGRYAASMGEADAAGLFLNVDGRQFIELLRQNSALRAMLAGINTAIDMDNIIKSIDGDMALIMPALGTGQSQMMMAAKLKHADWLADVDYWKRSVPAGGHIGDWGRDCYYYSGDNTTYFFGVTSDWQYMSGSSREAALRSIHPAINPVSEFVQDKIKGEKLVMVVNFSALNGSKAESLLALLQPLFGNLNAIVYTLK